MRYQLACALPAAALLALLGWPEAASGGVRGGLATCGEVIIPSLFPFFVLSAAVSELGIPQRLARRLAEPMSRLFGVSGAGASALVLGVLGGYPLGAASAADMAGRGVITSEECSRLLGFCNNSGPAFLVGAAGVGVFGSVRAGMALYACHVAAAVTSGVLMRGAHTAPAAAAPDVPEVRPGALARAVTASVKNMLNVCGFVIAFGVVTGTLDAVGLLPALALDLSRLTGLEISASRAAIVGFFELGGGVGAMRGLAATPVNLAVCAAVIGWGGLSVHFQTSAVVAGAEISTARHFTGRCLSAVFSFVYVLLLAPAVI